MNHEVMILIIGIISMSYSSVPSAAAAALSSIREISSNAHAAAGRVQRFIGALTDSVRHVGEAP